MSLKGQIEGKKGVKHPKFVLGFNLAPWTPSHFLETSRKAL